MSWRRFLGSRPERLRRWAYPKLGRFMLWAATYEARKELAGKRPLGILIDTCVLGIAVTHETVWLQRRGWGAATRVPVYDVNNQSEDHKQASYLTVLRHLVSLGHLQFWGSRSLEAERRLNPPGMVTGYGIFDRSLFKGFKIPNIDGRLPLAWGPERLGFESLEVQLRKELVRDPDDPTYAGLWSLLRPNVGPKGDQDVWHLSTAERHGLDFFLTTDSKFLSATRQLANKEPLRSMHAKAVSPEELGKLLKLHRVPPIVFSYEDTNVFVSTEAVMPNEKRRRRKR